jgi:glycosyltransferase involved in cell wall biosynthesis
VVPELLPIAALPRGSADAVRISAVVPVYGGELTLAEALCSILTQNFSGIEVIVLDDGSPDASLCIARGIKDDRLIVLHHANRGLAATLNRGISFARGRYVARQDQDDLVLAGRLEKQFAFLEAHPDVAMVGTWAQIYSGNMPTQRYHRHPCSSEALKLELLFDNPFVHSSMMIRTDVLRDVGGYCEDRSRQPPEDYELWSRVARQHRVANLPEVLTVYREMPGSMSRTGDNPFLKNVIRIASENLSHALSPRYSLEECNALADVYHRGGAGNSLASISRTQARQMLESAAQKLGGNKADWSEEFLVSYSRMRAHIDSRFLQRIIPTPLRAPMRWFRNQLFRRGS